MQTTSNLTQYKEQLRSYFDGIGFERWSAIYGKDEGLSSIRMSIREGHNKMLAQAEAWLEENNLPKEARILDAGCGTGVVCVALAKRGYQVTAVDIAPQMVKKARQEAIDAGVNDRITFVAGDLEVIGGTYDAVVCFDVLIHYPQEGFAQMCTRLAQLSRGPLIMTYAPYNRILAMKHWVGGHFPQSQRRTTIQMNKRKFVGTTLEAAGKYEYRSKRISHGFYHVALLEARPIETK